jgi:hypothetical protein
MNGMNLLTSFSGTKRRNCTILPSSKQKMRTLGNSVNTAETKKSLEMRDLREVVN